MKYTLIALVLVLGMATLAGAAPTFFGPTGLIVMPTAMTLDQGQINVFVNTIDLDPDNLTGFGGNFGVGYGVEVGATHLTNGDDITLVNAKWNFLKETADKPGIAVGAFNLTDEDEFGDIAPYISLSKALNLPDSTMAFAGHIGYIGGDIESLMLGASAVLAPQLTVMADWIDDVSDFSFGARWAATDALRIDAAVIDGDLGLQASYTFNLQ